MGWAPTWPHHHQLIGVCTRRRPARGTDCSPGPGPTPDEANLTLHRRLPPPLPPRTVSRRPALLAALQRRRGSKPDTAPDQRTYPSTVSSANCCGPASLSNPTVLPLHVRAQPSCGPPAAGPTGRWSEPRAPQALQPAHGRTRRQSTGFDDLTDGTFIDRAAARPPFEPPTPRRPSWCR